MLLLSRCTLIAVVALFAAVAAEQTASGQFRYPRVYGATGRPYGPTQAHYQYQRQYGRSWHGYGGLTASSASISAVSGFGGLNYYHGPVGGYGFPIAPYAITPYGTYYPPHAYYGGYSGPPGFADFGPNYSYIPMAPLVLQGHPQFIGPNPFDNAVMRDALRENDERWGQPIVIEPKAKAVPRLEIESSPASKLRSIRIQAQGDDWFRQQKYLQAYERYRVAVAEAGDRAEAHFRLALTYAALGRFELASASFQRGVAVDPEHASGSASLDDIFGLDNSLAKSAVASRAVEWVRADIRDPERLFLLGMWLYLDDQPDKAAVVFETALRLAGGGDHLTAMLEKSGAAVAAAPLAAPEIVPAKPIVPQVLQPAPAEPPAANAPAQPADPPGTAQPVLPPLPSP